MDKIDFIQFQTELVEGFDDLIEETAYDTPFVELTDEQRLSILVAVASLLFPDAENVDINVRQAHPATEENTNGE